ncbi:MAG TPA: NUDIX domain-containing protein [Acidimicrobiales bacterium]|nr:NUDIX domain-containing protein [Acidimicrobiales bacterium]
MAGQPGGSTGGGGTGPAARRAARLLVVNAEGRVLLFSGSDPSAPHLGRWWFTPGGGLEGDEDEAAAGRRELFEETGLEARDLGPVVHRQHASFDLDGRHFEQDEVFFAVRVDRSEVDESRRTEFERRFVHGHRWWSEPELASTTEVVFPAGLLSVLRRAGVFSRAPRV